MIIELRRHGDWDKKTGELTLKSKKEAKRLSRDEKYKIVFSAEPYRCGESAWIISGEWPIVSNAFNDIKPEEDIGKRIEDMIRIINSTDTINASDEVLVLTHNNLIAAVSYFFEGKKMPEKLDDLPVIPHLKGIRINISVEKA